MPRRRCADVLKPLAGFLALFGFTVALLGFTVALLGVLMVILDAVPSRGLGGPVMASGSGWRGGVLCSWERLEVFVSRLASGAERPGLHL